MGDEDKLTIIEMAKKYGIDLSKARDYSDNGDLHTYPGVVTYNAKCSSCASPTLTIDPAAPNDERFCLSCLMKFVARMTETDWEWDENSENPKTIIADKDSEIDMLNARINELSIDLTLATTRLAESRNKEAAMVKQVATIESVNEAIKEECDELRGRVDEFEDDRQADKNEVERLKLEVKKWKDAATRRAATST